jgi:hypothetical protein
MMIDGLIKVFIVAAVILLILCAAAWPAMELWNNFLVGAVDGIKPITYSQTLGIMVLSRLLFATSASTKF